MSNRPASFGATPQIPPMHRFGGTVASNSELAIHAMGDTYLVEGSGTVRSLPAWPKGPPILVYMLGTPTFIASSKLLMPAGQSYAFSPGDTAWILPLGDGFWRVIDIRTADGSPYLAGTKPQAGGRLTLQQSVPVMNADQTAATVLYYAPSDNENISLLDGNNMRPYRFTSGPTDTIGLSLTLGSNWAPSTLFDSFITLVGGSPVIATVAWSTSAAGTSTRATALAYYRGLQTNATGVTARISNSSTITMGANQGTYVGTFLTNGSAGQIDFKFGSAAVGGGTAIQSVWNMYNPVQCPFVVTDTTSTNGVSSANTMQPFNVGGTGSGLNNRINFVQGFASNPILADFDTCANPASGHAAYIAIGLNSASAPWSRSKIAVVVGSQTNITAFAKGYAPIGANYLQALYEADTTSTPFFGNASRTFEALTAEIWC